MDSWRSVSPPEDEELQAHAKGHGIALDAGIREAEVAALRSGVDERPHAQEIALSREVRRRKDGHGERRREAAPVHDLRARTRNGAVLSKKKEDTVASGMRGGTERVSPGASAKTHSSESRRVGRPPRQTHGGGSVPTCS